MSKRRYQAVLNRQQEMLMPLSVEDYVSPNNVVRAIDAYVNSLDMEPLGFQHSSVSNGAGQPPFAPEALLKLYLYGYQQGICSSRKLEKETHRNIEVMWLIEGIRPTYKTIANVRSHNSLALKAASRDFVLLCKELSLLGGEKVGVDGSFFSGNVSKEHIYTEKQLETQLSRIEQKIETYQAALDEQDKTEDKAPLENTTEIEGLEKKRECLKEKQAEKIALQQQMQTAGDKPVSSIDKDARLLSKGGSTTAGYNVQIAVDEKHKLIVAQEVTQEGNDKKQLYPMLNPAQSILQSSNLAGLADKGYFESSPLKYCEDNGITVYVPIPAASKRIADQGRLTRDRLTYDKKQDGYICPQQHILKRYGKLRVINNKNHMTYKSLMSDCKSCSEKANCLGKNSKVKQLTRWEHEEVIERHAEKMKQTPTEMHIRSSLVEHPFGIIKQRAGIKHFLMRGLEKCRGEFSLMVLGFNFTRVLNIIGVQTLQDYCAQR